MAYCSVADVKTYLGISGSGDDDLIADCIAEAEQAINTYTDREFESPMDSTHYFTVGVDTGCGELLFDEDLCQLTSVINNADGTPETLTRNTDFIVMPRNKTPWYGLRLLTSSNKYWNIQTTRRWVLQ